MDQFLTRAEIESQFPGEWVLIGDPTKGRGMHVEGGVLLCHSKDRDEIYDKAVALRPVRFAVLFTGPMPADSIIVI